jgi:hypothetical protein
MITDAELKVKGMRALLDSLGEAQAERFIALIMREPFDYTMWQRSLLADKNIKEISSRAVGKRTEEEANE